MLSSPSMFNAPETVRESKPGAAYIQPTLNHGLRIWWGYYWPTSLIGGLLLICSTYWLRVLYERAAITAHTFKLWAAVFPYAFTALVGLLIFRYILGKRFRHFRVALLPRAHAESVPLRPIWRRTARVWWTFTWRSIVYSIVLGFLVNVSLGTPLGMLRETSQFLAAFIPLAEGLLIAAGVGLFVIYSNVLDEEFGDFRVALLPRQEPAPAAAPTSSPASPEAPSPA